MVIIQNILEVLKIYWLCDGQNYYIEYFGISFGEVVVEIMNRLIGISFVYEMFIIIIKNLYVYLFCNFIFFRIILQKYQIRSGCKIFRIL